VVLIPERRQEQRIAWLKTGDDNNQASVVALKEKLYLVNSPGVDAHARPCIHVTLQEEACLVKAGMR